MPANDAKRLLFDFSEKYRSKVSSTYLVAGWTKGASPQHVVQLVDASAIADKRSKLDPVTSLHVYSIQPTAPKARTASLYILYLYIFMHSMTCIPGWYGVLKSPHHSMRALAAPNTLQVQW